MGQLKPFVFRSKILRADPARRQSLSFKMFDGKISRHFIAPRRQERKENIVLFFSELGVLCVFARVISSCSVSQHSTENFKYVWLAWAEPAVEASEPTLDSRFHGNDLQCVKSFLTF
jgi:hypothetical protein